MDPPGRNFIWCPPACRAGQTRPSFWVRPGDRVANFPRKMNSHKLPRKCKLDEERMKEAIRPVYERPGSRDEGLSLTSQKVPPAWLEEFVGVWEPDCVRTTCIFQSPQSTFHHTRTTTTLPCAPPVHSHLESHHRSTSTWAGINVVTSTTTTSPTLYHYHHHHTSFTHRRPSHHQSTLLPPTQTGRKQIPPQNGLLA